MLSPVAQRFYETLIAIATTEKKIFLSYSEIPQYIGSDKCLDELVCEKLIVRYTTAIGIHTQPVLPIKSDLTCRIVQEVVKKYGLF